MTPERYRELWDNDLTTLTEAEQKAGWHFCIELDGSLERMQDGCEFCDFKPPK